MICPHCGCQIQTIMKAVPGTSKMQDVKGGCPNCGQGITFKMQDRNVPRIMKRGSAKDIKAALDRARS